MSQFILPKSKIHLLFAEIAFIAFILITLPTSKIGIKHTIPLLIAGILIIVIKKHRINFEITSKKSTYVGLGSTIYFGIYFYKRWLLIPQIHTIASFFHLPLQLLVIVTAVTLSVFSAPFFIWILQIPGLIINTTKNQQLTKDILFILFVSVVVVFIAQIMIEQYVLSMGLFRFFWNVLIVFVAQLLFYFLHKNIQISVILGTVGFMAISTINRYVYSFRSRLLEPVDIFSFETAFNVANNYSLFPIPFSVILGWVIWALIIYVAFNKCRKNKPKISTTESVKILITCLLGFIFVFSYSYILKTYHWEMEGALHNGYILDFTSKIKEALPKHPKEYNRNTIENLAEKYQDSGNTAQTNEIEPHIIVIMNEAFSDLSVLGELTTNMEVTPFISSLKQNVISGYALSSVYGGNTANSEYEFLTGNTMAFLSPNSVPYQQYVKNPAYSMVSYLKSTYRYRCIAMHPYLSSGWNRPSTYAYFGFDEILFVEDFPQKNYIRDYISDQEMIEKIVEIYEKNQTDPLFIFGITMQNHGNYAYSGDRFKQHISLTGYKNDFSAVEQYLSLLYETDKAMEYLISYFSNVEDNVVIVFFGDHQPKFNDDFYKEISGNQLDSLDNQQKQYMVPFFIWSNYDTEEKENQLTSLNYLSNYVYDMAGISLPPYNQFLSEMIHTIPVINSNGFYSKESECYLSFDQASSNEAEWLKLYEILQYNSMFDTENRNTILFPILK